MSHFGMNLSTRWRVLKFVQFWTEFAVAAPRTLFTAAAHSTSTHRCFLWFITVRAPTCRKVTTPMDRGKQTAMWACSWHLTVSPERWKDHTIVFTQQNWQHLRVASCVAAKRFITVSWQKWCSLVFPGSAALCNWQTRKAAPSNE